MYQSVFIFNPIRQENVSKIISRGKQPHEIILQFHTASCKENKDPLS